VFAACPPTEGTKYNSHYRKFASYNDYVLVHLYTVVQFSSGSDFGSCVQFWVCARRRGSSSSCSSPPPPPSPREHMFLRRFKVFPPHFSFFLVVQRSKNEWKTTSKSRTADCTFYTRAVSLSADESWKMRAKSKQVVLVGLVACFVSARLSVVRNRKSEKVLSVASWRAVWMESCRRDES
jgi:hypothetical protein